ncbi:hypothetical protein [Alkaliphilus peptidifermentans]|uniref:YceG-like family protein n=1 Tax=Alkaliphilus peptidifermentans DSM 18978 TaxID=1120976 RepID=A0A1G5DEZ2_9FIRM|nr:hypothetical protein [Alkaliphilus peptidifermentans]SCY13107.1 hypothetical protein SAMN03080606_00885 [Alkaliphilus peptidifermentans DSM 18978]
MKRFCILSLIIGIGIGMIITASINIIFQGNQHETAITLKNQQDENDMEKGIGQLKSVELTEKQDNKIIEDEGINEEDFVENNNIDEKDLENDEGFYEVYITNGMTTQQIAKSLNEAGAVDDINAFIDYSITKKVTTKFRIGYKKIPVGSSYDDIISILTTISRDE